MRSLLFAIAICSHWNGEKTTHTDKEWLKILGRERYFVMREKGTEKPFLNAYVLNTLEGTYFCAGCSLPLFHSSNKYHAGNGWPSFTNPICEKHLYYLEDRSLGWKRYEVLCRKCDAHLGHVFPDGPTVQGDGKNSLRYCINSTSLFFIKK